MWFLFQIYYTETVLSFNPVGIKDNAHLQDQISEQQEESAIITTESATSTKEEVFPSAPDKLTTEISNQEVEDKKGKHVDILDDKEATKENAPEKLPPKSDSSKQINTDEIHEDGYVSEEEIPKEATERVTTPPVKRRLFESSSPELGDRDDTALQTNVGLREKRTYATRNADENEEEDDICSQNYKRPTPEPAVDVDRSNGKLYY